MNKQDLEKYRKILLEKRKELLNKSSGYKADDVLAIKEEEMTDETDVASQTTMPELSCSLINRDFEILKKITDALESITDQTYGICEECGEDIAPKRLLLQPWANYCIPHAEAKEYRKKITNLG